MNSKNIYTFVPPPKCRPLNTAKITGTLFLLVLSIFTLFFYSCGDGLFGSDDVVIKTYDADSWRDTGNRYPGKGRSVFRAPDDADGEGYYYKVSLERGRSLYEKEIPEGSIVEMSNIPVGTWKVTCRAYHADGSIVAMGSAEALIEAGVTTTVEVELKNCPVVTFILDADGNSYSQTVEFGGRVTKPENPTKEGLAFAGWYVDANYTTEFDFSTAIKENITLYAKWVTAYQVGMASEIRNGSVIADKTSAAAGATVTLTFKPSEGFELNSLSIKDADGRKIDTRVVTAGEKYTFTMPAVNVTVFATFMTYDGFVKVNGGRFDGTYTLTPASCIFISGRDLTIPDFYMCTHEVTQKEYETYCTYRSTRPSDTYGKGDNYPAYNVSWFNALVYCNKRSLAEDLAPCYTIDGKTDPDEWGNAPASSASQNYSTWLAVECNWSASGYRLPMEVEWEYAARNENKDSYNYSGSDNLDEVAWCKDNSDGKSHEVRQKAPNGLGIYDMTGNVWEMCWDVGGRGINADTPITGKVDRSSDGRIRRGEGWN
ncbi:MAG: SUMF1/EgtB/PvdO family nonheme iron enzyme, partial [Treponema sp.]|nr:SUMF1/EgtB/PvdO family nonheme iron enzyme [Treponema sp.]